MYGEDSGSTGATKPQPSYSSSQPEQAGSVTRQPMGSIRGALASAGIPGHVPEMPLPCGMSGNLLSDEDNGWPLEWQMPDSELDMQPEWKQQWQLRNQQNQQQKSQQSKTNAKGELPKGGAREKKPGAWQHGVPQATPQRQVDTIDPATDPMQQLPRGQLQQLQKQHQQQQRHQREQRQRQHQHQQQQLHDQMHFEFSSLGAMCEGQEKPEDASTNRKGNGRGKAGEEARRQGGKAGDMFGGKGGKDDNGPDGGPGATLRRNKWINRQVTRIADTGNLQRLLQTVQFHIAEMNGINLATAIHRVTKLAVSSTYGISTEQLLTHPSFQLLRSTVVKHIDMQKIRASMGQSGNEMIDMKSQPIFEIQCMSIVCWSCATLRLREEKLMGKIADIVLPCLNELKPFELSNMLWAYAKLSLGKPALLAAVSERMLNRKNGEFSMQCLSMIAWSFATEKQRDAAVFSSIAGEIMCNAASTKPQEIANTLWAYAKNRCAEVGLFHTLADTAISNNMLWSFKPQELSNTVWAFATISLQHMLLFKHVVVVAISKRNELSPQNIANILWAYAKLQVCRRSGLFPALLSVSVGMMPQHKPHEISAIVWAAAKENYPACRRFFGATAQMCAQRLHEFPPQALANMVEAFAVIEADSPSFSEAMARESVGRLHQFDPMALSNLFRGVVLTTRRARAAGSPDHKRQLHVLGAIATHIASRVSQLQPSELCHVEHSLQLLGPAMCKAIASNLQQSVVSETGRQFGQKECADMASMPSISGFDTFDLDSFDPEESEEPGEYESEQAPRQVDTTEPTGPAFDSQSWQMDDSDLPPLLLSDVANEIDAPEQEEYGDHMTKIHDALKSFGNQWEPGANDGPSNRHRRGGKKQVGARGFHVAGLPTMPNAQGPDFGEGNYGWDDGWSAYGSPNTWRQQGPRTGPPPIAPFGSELDIWTQRVPVPPVAFQNSWGNHDHGTAPGSSGLPQSASGGGGWSSAPQWGSMWSGPPPVSRWQTNVGNDDDNWHGNLERGWPPTKRLPLNALTAPGSNTDNTVLPIGHPGYCEPGSDTSISGLVWRPKLVDPSCLVQLVSGMDGDTSAELRWQPLEMRDHLHAALIGNGSMVVRLRCGVLDERVVVKRMAVLNEVWPLDVTKDPHVLAPCALVSSALDDLGDAYTVYPYCQSGTLGEWILCRFGSGKPMLPNETAHLVLGILDAAQTFVAHGLCITSFRADEIFICPLSEPRVRLRPDQHLRSRDSSASAGSAAKWLAPEEVTGNFHRMSGPSTDIIWQCMSFRIGLLLYCIGAQTPDPYPHKRGELVLLDLSREATQGGVPVRPNMSQYAGNETLRELVESCLHSQADHRPACDTIRSVLTEFLDS